MAQQATSAQQREPSMEEILASIRRIIEDSEPVRTRLAEPAASAIDEPAIGPVANDIAPQPLSARLASPAEPARTPIQPAAMFGARRTETVPPPAPVRTEATLPPKAETRVEPIRVETIEPARLEPSVLELRPAVEAPATPEPKGVLERDDEIDIDIEALSAAIEEETRSTTATTQWDSAFLKSLDDKASPAKTEAKPESSTQASSATSSSALALGKGAILSAQTGKQVAASFGALSEAFAASRQRSFDEMAEEMLQPMLQDWLDNNLPLLVEKLVREEIERVARGA